MRYTLVQSWFLLLLAVFLWALKSNNIHTNALFVTPNVGAKKKNVQKNVSIIIYMNNYNIL